MISRIKIVHLDLIDQLKTILDEYNFELFKYCNIWNNQFERAIKAQDYSFATPACFIEIEFGEAMQLGNKVTSYPNFFIRFRLVNNVLDGGNDTMEQNLEIFDLRDSIIRKFKGSGKIRYCSTLQQIEDEPDYDHTNMYMYCVGFITNFIDATGSYLEDGGGCIVDGLQINLNIIAPWISEREYIENLNVCYIDKKIYVCKTTNSDSTFNVDNWILVSGWTVKSYQVGDYVMYYSTVYRCSIANEDTLFNINNWTTITFG